MENTQQGEAIFYTDFANNKNNRIKHIDAITSL